ncbi:hypothetical protein SASPL_102057 [Salvia splendens]|uniref:Plastocyanin-like domain-containing protein n=1 Tax=Salvia splendens TaxID=180675 RepID=A0A8X8YVM9_SALSN|nr:hypothetical protein SASPL_102057 [Salvia splendens]
MAASAYHSVAGVPFPNTTTTGIIAYSETMPSTPILPLLPAFNDTPMAHRFSSNITALVSSRFWAPVPRQVDERIDVGGVYTTDFPDNPPLQFDYTNSSNSFNRALLNTTKSTNVKKLKFNSTVEVVLQNTALIGIENHPIHLHGFNFYVLAQGFGNYNPSIDSRKFNFVNPQERNTIGVPVGGWAVIRCVVDALSLGCTLAMGSGNSFRGGKWAYAGNNATSTAAGFSQVLIMLEDMYNLLGEYH